MALARLGFVASYPPVPAAPLLRGAILGTVRDVMLVARDDLELLDRTAPQIVLCRGAACGFPASAGRTGPMPVPAIGPDLAFYLIAHGALSYWVRLKWLVDLLPMFARLSDAERLAVLDRARRARCENSVAASLLLLRRLFPFAAIAPLIPWLEEMQTRPAVRRRLRRYCELALPRR